MRSQGGRPFIGMLSSIPIRYALGREDLPLIMFELRGSLGLYSTIMIYRAVQAQDVDHHDPSSKRSGYYYPGSLGSSRNFTNTVEIVPSGSSEGSFAWTIEFVQVHLGEKGTLTAVGRHVKYQNMLLIYHRY